MAKKRKWSKVRAIIKTDRKSPLFGRAHFSYRITAEGVGFKVIAIVDGFNRADAERRFRKTHKRFRHEVRTIGADLHEWPITIERL